MSLIVYDPSDAWPLWRAGNLPFDKTVTLAGRRVLRLRTLDRRAHDVVIVVPTRGLAHDESAPLSHDGGPARRFFVAPIGPNQRITVPRGGLGWRDLGRELRETFGSRLAPVPVEEPDMVLRALSADSDEIREALAVEAEEACLRRTVGGHWRSPLSDAVSQGIAEGRARALAAVAGLSRTGIPEIDAWARDEAVSFTAQTIVLPVLGPFSSGKSTLLNAVIGQTPGGHQPLRTCHTHNTAAATWFRYGHPARVEFKWRDRVSFVLRRWEGDDLSAPPLLADADEVRVFQQPDAAKAVLALADAGAIDGVALRTHRVQWLGRKPSLRVDTKKLEPKRTRTCRPIVDIASERLSHRDLLVEHGQVVRADVDATVAARALPTTRPLETEDDWAWFQGSAEERRSGIEPRGFAESNEATWLLDRAEVCVDNPLFDLVTVLDAPGVGSTSPQHDRVAEECARRGQAWLIVSKTDRQLEGAWLETTLGWVRSAIGPAGSNPLPERVFFLLNWDHTTPEPSARKRIETFTRRVGALLGGRPQVYVADLADKHAQEMLLGRPSLAALVRDLRGHLAAAGHAGRVRDAAKAVADTTRCVDERISNALIACEGEVDPRRLARLNALHDDLLASGALRQGLQSMVVQAFADARDAARSFDSLFDGLIDYNVFEELRDLGPPLADAWNHARSRILQSLGGDIAGRLARACGGPDVRGPRPLSLARGSLDAAGLEDLAPIASDSLRMRAAQIVAGWPNPLLRLWSLFRNGEWHATTVGGQIREEFSGARLRIERAAWLARAERAYLTEIARACDEALFSVRDRRSEIAQSAADRDASRTRILAERDRLRALDAKIAHTRRELDAAASAIEGGLPGKDAE